MKRLVDIILAATALVFLAPVIAVVWVLVANQLGRPVLFRQKRIGLNGRVFEIAKFRTMREAYGPDGEPLPDEQRMTPLGETLRRYRLDELPELWAILLGEMSFVGPRPLAIKDHVGPVYLTERERVRPGLTGLAQVSGNTLLSNAEKFAIDAWYVHDPRLTKDVEILVQTALTIVKGEARDEPLIQKAMDYAQRLDRGG
jgi:lipopolysaccharide/colanic/teichoic acid biosynthesis glycosyltransferase